MALADHGVRFPVPEALPAIGRLRPGLNAHPVGDAAAVAHAPAVLAVFLLMTVQMQVQLAAGALVLGTC